MLSAVAAATSKPGWTADPRPEDRNCRRFSACAATAPRHDGDRALAINDQLIRNLSSEYDTATRRYKHDIRHVVAIDEILLDGTPRQGRSLEIEGRYISSRTVDGTARVAIAGFGSGLELVDAGDSAGDTTAADANREVVAQSTLEQWLPDYRVVSPEGSVIEEGPVLACDRVYVPSEFSGFGTLMVLNVDLSESLTLADGVATLADSETIYVSAENPGTWRPTRGFRRASSTTGTTGGSSALATERRSTSSLSHPARRRSTKRPGR